MPSALGVRVWLSLCTVLVRLYPPRGQQCLRRGVGLLVLLSSVGNVGPGYTASVAPVRPRLPVVFEANHGQTDAAVKFLARGPGATLLLTPTAAITHLGTDLQTPASPHASEAEAAPLAPTVVRMQLVGAQPTAALVGEARLPGEVHYLRGRDPHAWHTHIPTYARVRVRNVYPGIDLVYHSQQRALEFDFLVAPGTEVAQIRLAYTGVDRVTLDPQGALLIQTPRGVVRQRPPQVAQEHDGVRHRCPERESRGRR